MATDEQAVDCLNYVHVTICGNHPRVRSCDGPRLPGIQQSLDHLAARPNDAAGARIILHDLVCIYGPACSGREFHSKRHTAAVVAIRKWRKQNGL